jgi:hypoxanthine phosphoribosyltransferase
LTLTLHYCIKSVMESGSLTPLFGPRSIRSAVRRLAREIDGDCGGQPLTVVGVLKGSFVFLADLVRLLETPVTVDFVRLSSYGGGTRPGRLRLSQDVGVPVRGRHVLVVDDIVDTGRTTRYLLQRMKRRRPLTCRVCTLLDKPSRREVPVAVDYCGFVVPDVFVVGYGLDLDERYRQLPAIFSIPPSGLP